MKNIVLGLALISAILLAVTGCSTVDQTNPISGDSSIPPVKTSPVAAISPTALSQTLPPPPPSPTASETPGQPSANAIQPPPPGWTFTNAEDLRRWEESRSFSTDSLEEASRFVGYQITTPSYIPEGFRPFPQDSQPIGRIMITQLGGGLPSGMQPKFLAINVDQRWEWNENSLVSIMLTQSQHKFGVGGEQSQIEISGIPVTRAVTQGEPPRPNVMFNWEKSGFYYALVGYLGGPLDEGALLKVFNSLNMP